MSEQDDLKRASEHLDQAADHLGEAAHHTKEAIEAGASGTLERARGAVRETGRRVEQAADRTVDAAGELGRKAGDVAGEAGRKASDLAGEAGRTAGHVAEHLRHSTPDVALEGRVESGTEQALDRTGQAVRGAAPTVGRGVESAVEAAGSALHAMSGPVAAVVGKIAGRVGGWWSSAADAVVEMPEAEVKLCRTHFESYQGRPAGLDFDVAQTAYHIGYVAGANPAYRERRFEDVETDLSHGLQGAETQEYAALRDFARFGYERATIVRMSPTSDRVTIE
jgi:hypothetical protein